MAEDETWDAVVVGGGPAGLAAALWLARYRRRVRVFDAQDPRNAPTWGVHGYLGLTDPPPFELRRVGREQAIAAGAEFEAAMVEKIEGEEGDFRVTLSSGSTVRARRVMLCTGLKDIIPEIPGLLDFYGRSIWHCPDCDGPSAADKRIGVIGWGRSIAAFCMYMLTWTDRITLLTHGHPPDLPEKSQAALDRFGIPVRTEVIDSIEGEVDMGCMTHVVFHGGETLELDHVFFHIACGPGSTLAADLGCEVEEDQMMEGILKVDANFQTSTPGIYAAGDIVPGSRLALRAAAEGTRAALGIHKSLTPEDRKV
jgi:thioredoxin reductase